MLSGVGAEYSRRDLFAINLNVGVKLRLLNLPRQKSWVENQET
jgi:hypothetical protein